jgi:hypothetical protein
MECSLPQHEMLADVRFGSKGDMCAAKGHVRFTPESGHVPCTSSCPLCANSGLVQRSKNKRYSITSLRSLQSIIGWSSTATVVGPWWI